MAMIKSMWMVNGWKVFFYFAHNSQIITTLDYHLLEWSQPNITKKLIFKSKSF